MPPLCYKFGVNESHDLLNEDEAKRLYNDMRKRLWNEQMNRMEQPVPLMFFLGIVLGLCASIVALMMDSRF